MLSSLSIAEQTSFLFTNNNWDDTENWTNGIPTSSVDVYQTGTIKSVNLSSGGSVNNLIFEDVVLAGHVDYATKGDFSVAGNLSFNGYFSANNWGGLRIIDSGSTASTLSIGGDVDISASPVNADYSLGGKAEVFFGSTADYTPQFKAIEIGGDINLTANSNYGAILNLNGKTVTVDGVANLSGEKAELRLMRTPTTQDSFTSDISIGGINGVGAITIACTKHGYEKNTKNTVNLTLTNSTNQTWIGKLNRTNVSWVSEKTDETTGEVTSTSYATTNEFNLTMNATDSTKNQKLVITNKVGLDSITTESGKLDIYTAATIGTINLKGGELSALAYNTSSKEVSEYGTINATNLVWYGGAIGVNIASVEDIDNDIINVVKFDKGATKTGDYEVAFTFAEDLDILTFLEAEGELLKYTILNFTDDDSSFTQEEADMIKATGLDKNISCEFTIENNSLVANLLYVAVPEPETCATFIAALALGFAYLRRRK